MIDKFQCAYENLKKIVDEQNKNTKDLPDVGATNNRARDLSDHSLYTGRTQADPDQREVLLSMQEYISSAIHQI